MNEQHKITFNVTPSHLMTIELRAGENGFNDISSYIKVVALKTQPFTLSPMDASDEEKSVELEFHVSEAQKERINENVQESGCPDLETYLRYVALHGVVTSVVEVRSTGNLDAMLARIAASKRK